MAGFERVSKVVMVVGCAVESEEVGDGVREEKMVVFGEILLVVSILKI